MFNLFRGLKNLTEKIENKLYSNSDVLLDSGKDKVMEKYLEKYSDLLIKKIEEKYPH